MLDQEVKGRRKRADHLYLFATEKNLLTELFCSKSEANTSMHISSSVLRISRKDRDFSLIFTVIQFFVFKRLIIFRSRLASNQSGSPSCFANLFTILGVKITKTDIILSEINHEKSN